MPDHKNVNLDELRNQGSTTYLKQQFRNKHIEYLFLTKDKEWEYEREKRLIHFGDESTLEYCSIERSLESIYLGVDFHRSYLPTLKDLCPNTEIIPLEYKGVRLIPAYDKFTSELYR